MYGRMYEDKNITICRKVETENSACNLCRALFYTKSLMAFVLTGGFATVSSIWRYHKIIKFTAARIAIYVQSQGLQKVVASHTTNHPL